MRIPGQWWPLPAVLVPILVGIYLTVDNWCWLTGNGNESPGATVRNVSLVIAGPVTLILAFWRINVTQRQAETAHRSAETAHRSLHDERYRAAVGMLENKQLFVRLGAIDTLRQLAHTYPVDFHLRVVRLLAAFVRHPPLNEQDGRPQDGVREEVQVILVFYGDRSKEALKIEDNENVIIDLQGSDLSGIWLRRGANLARVRLANCNFSGATLNGVDGLTPSQIRGAKADPPPSFLDVIDCETGQPLAWPPTVSPSSEAKSGGSAAR